MSARRAGFLGDSRALSVTAVILALGIAAAAFIVSYQGLADLGAAIGLGRMNYILPLMLDGGILTAGLLAAVRRGQKRRATLELTILWAATAMSSAANFAAHTERGDGWLPATTASLAPWFLLAVTESIIRTVIQDEVVVRKPRRARKSAPAEPASVTASAVAPTAPAVSAARPRPAPRTAPSSAPATYPFDEVDGVDGDVLLERLRTLHANPASSQRGTAESASFTVSAWALVERHGWTPTTLAQEVGDPNRDRINDRVRRARAQREVVNA